MGKTAFIFPGQGAQKAGMGKDFYEKYDTAKDVFDSAGKWLDLDMKALCYFFDLLCLHSHNCCHASLTCRNCLLHKDSSFSYGSNSILQFHAACSFNSAVLAKA